MEKNTSRKFVRAACVLAAIAMTVQPSCAFAGETEAETVQAVLQDIPGTYSYEIMEDGTARITGYNYRDHESELNIPSQIDGIPVTAIGDNALSDLNCKTIYEDGIEVSANSKIRKVTLPDGLLTIGERAFEACGMIQVIIPDSVVSIGDFAFSGCYLLRSVTIPPTTSMSSNAFEDCWSLSAEASQIQNATQAQNVESTDIYSGEFNLDGSVSVMSPDQIYTLTLNTGHDVQDIRTQSGYNDSYTIATGYYLPDTVTVPTIRTEGYMDGSMGALRTAYKAHQELVDKYNNGSTEGSVSSLMHIVSGGKNIYWYREDTFDESGTAQDDAQTKYTFYVSLDDYYSCATIEIYTDPQILLESGLNEESGLTDGSAEDGDMKSDLAADADIKDEALSVPGNYYGDEPVIMLDQDTGLRMKMEPVEDCIFAAMVSTANGKPYIYAEESIWTDALLSARTYAFIGQEMSREEIYNNFCEVEDWHLTRETNRSNGVVHTEHFFKDISYGTINGREASWFPCIYDEYSYDNAGYEATYFQCSLYCYSIRINDTDYAYIIVQARKNAANGIENNRYFLDESDARIIAEKFSFG